MDLYKQLATLFLATESSPLRVAGVEFWVDSAGPWAGQLSYSTPAHLWNVALMVEEVTALARVYPEVQKIVAQFA